MHLKTFSDQVINDRELDNVVMPYTVRIEPSRTPGKVTATSSDSNTFTTSIPLLDGARYSLGAPSTASICTIWSSGPGHWALRSTVGHAAGLRPLEAIPRRLEGP
jgi:hypothetical protein